MASGHEIKALFPGIPDIFSYDNVLNELQNEKAHEAFCVINRAIYTMIPKHS